MNPLFDLSGKTAAITGAASGIGASIAQVFARQGAHVCILDIDDAGATAMVASIKEAGGQAQYYRCDIVSYQEVTDTFDQLYQDHGQLNIFVNNAAIAHIGNVETTSEEDMDRVYQVNIKGAYNCLHAAVKKMKLNHGGAILNMASVASVLGLKDRFAYSMSKGAILTMTYSVAKDFIEDNIRCNAIGPARVHTPFVDGFLKANYPGREKEVFDQLSATQPIGRMGTPDEIAYLALYLCSDEAGFVTGSFFPIDGGFIRLNT